MRIGVIDSEATLWGDFFSNKVITSLQKKNTCVKTHSHCGYTHSELVIASILKQDPYAEIVLYPLKKHDDKFLLVDVEDGIEKLMCQDVDIINLSLGIEGTDTKELKSVIHSVVEKGIYIVAAFENSTKEEALPAAFNEVLGVCMNVDKVGEKCFEYKPEKNNIYFKHNSTDFYQLGLPYTIEGNSFLSATVTGIISSFESKEKKISIEKIMKMCVNELLPIDWIQQENIVVDQTEAAIEKDLSGITIYKYIAMANRNYRDIVVLMEKIEHKDKKNLVFYLKEKNQKYEQLMNKLIQQFGVEFEKVILTRPYYRYYELYEYKKIGTTIYQGGW